MPRRMSGSERAIKQFQTLTVDEYKDPESQLEATARHLRRSYYETGDMSYNSRAIEMFVQVLDKTLPDDEKYSSSCHLLATGYTERYLREKEARDTDDAIDWYQKAWDGETKPYRHVERIYYLATAHEISYQQNGESKDRDNALRLFRCGLESMSSAPMCRLDCAQRLILMYAAATSWGDAYDVATATLMLFQKLNACDFDHPDFIAFATSLGNLFTATTAIVLQKTQDPFEALQHFESSRRILRARSNKFEDQFAEHLEAHKDLEDEFRRCRAQVYSPDCPDRTQAWQDLDSAISEIHRLPGLQTYLLPPGKEAIQAAAQLGPIVMVNASSYRCDALLIRHAGITAVPLPDLKVHDIAKRARQTDFGSSKTLEWMWDVIANPIMIALGFTSSPPAGAWPRVWWILPGLLSKFPLHAAGYHYEQASRAVIDRVMSSYSSSVRDILQTRSTCGAKSPATTGQQALLVSVPYVERFAPLAYAAEEVEKVAALCSSMGVTPVQPGGRKSDIITNLTDSQIFHFAGHGLTDKEDIMSSFLLPEDGREEDPLRVSTILDLDLGQQKPFLAYLSACGTGEVLDEALLDEALQITTAFQLAGYRHVIGTLWEVHDAVCVDVASTFYETLRDRGLSDESVCLGLHTAIRRLRDEWVKGLSSEPGSEALDGIHGQGERNEGSRNVGRRKKAKRKNWSNWIPYVHYGV